METDTLLTPPKENLNYPYDDVEPVKTLPDDELVIDESNFDQHFFDVRYHEPKDGQCMARFRARAEFVDGQLKRDVAQIIMYMHTGGDGAYKVMRKLAGASERDAIRIPLQMGTDLCSGLSVDQVCEKPYEYDCEFFFYTDPLNVPFDKRWEIIKLIGNHEQTGYITSNVHEKIAEHSLNTGSENSQEEDYGKPGPVRQLGGEVGSCPEEVGCRGRDCTEGTTEAE